MNSKTVQAWRSVFIGSGTGPVAIGKHSGRGMKGIRINGTGVLSIIINPTPEEAADFVTYKQDWDVLHGEQIQIQGEAIVQTDGTCSLQVLY